MHDTVDAKQQSGRPVRRRPVRRVFSVALFVGLVGCQSFQPLPREDLQPGAQIRAHLSAVGMGHVAEARGDANPTVTGRAVAVDGVQLGLEYWRNDMRMARQFRVQRDTLWLPWSEVVRVDEQRFSALRTGLFVGGLAVGTGIIVAALLSGGEDQSGGPGPNPNGGTPLRVIPLVQFHP